MRAGLKFSDWCLYNKTKDTETHREDGHVAVETEISEPGIMWSQILAPPLLAGVLDEFCSVSVVSWVRYGSLGPREVIRMGDRSKVAASSSSTMCLVSWGPQPLPT